MNKVMKHRVRRFAAIVLICFLSLAAGAIYEASQRSSTELPINGQTLSQTTAGSEKAVVALEKLEVKGRAPKTDYARSQFGSGWLEVEGCDMRNLILARDLTDEFIDPEDNCTLIRGQLQDPYTDTIINFQRGEQTSQAVQIDHVIALSDAWQKGAQQLSKQQRELFANDPLNLLAVDGKANQNKGDGDAASWLPPNKAYRCRYVARQVAVKLKYQIWVTLAEKDAIKRQLQTCPDQVIPVEIVGETAS